MNEAIYVMSSVADLLTIGLIWWTMDRVTALESANKDERPDI